MRTLAQLDNVVGRLEALDNVTKRTLLPLIKTDDYIMDPEDEGIVCDKAIAIAITLPPSVGGGRVYTVSNIGLGLATVTRAGADAVDGGTDKIITQWASMDFWDYLAGYWKVI